MSTHDEAVVAFRDVISIPGVPWIRLRFAKSSLGERSYVLLRSLEDGADQRLDRQAMERWDATTAYFNGHSVELELHVAPYDRDVFVEIDTVLVGATGGPPGTEPEERTLCGFDERERTTDNRIGRLLPVGCTGWLVSNGAYLTAGHCADGAGLMQIIEFNVPASDCNGDINFADPDDQYPIDASTIDFVNVEEGRDWAVFAVGRNANHNQLPIERYGGFFRMTRDDSPSDVRVTGFGIDHTPEGCTQDLNSDNQTEQTNTGFFRGEHVASANDVTIEYEVDTEGGNSGSPVSFGGLALGIHTNGGCFPLLDGNIGTGFESNELETAIRDFTSADATFVDEGHPGTNEDGTVMRPFDTVAAGANAVAAGGVLSIVAGSYDETLVFDRAMTVRATVGSVTMGQ